MSKEIVEFNKVFSMLVKNEAAELRVECWNQLKKDFDLSGIPNFPVVCPKELNSIIDSLSSFIRNAKNKTTNWDNVNYRIDMPQEIDYSSLSEHEYAQLLLWRIFQKVWIRRNYSM